MAIDFPSSPVAGSTYTYQGVTYTWIDTSGGSGADGFWKVNTPGTLGPATGAEVDTGTDNAKYVTPLAMEDSSYVKDQYYGVYSYYDVDELDSKVTGIFSGDTTLGADTADLHAMRMGRMVMLSGSLIIDGLTSASSMPNELACDVEWDITTVLSALGVSSIQGGNGAGQCTPDGGGADYSGFAVRVTGVNGTNKIGFISSQCQSFPFATSFNQSTPSSARFTFSIMLDVI